jgi:hypothetical protein
MKASEKIKNLNKAIEPYYLLILMLVFFLGGFSFIYKVFLAPPDLLVTIQKENINYPSSINKDYLDIYTYIQESTKDDKLKLSAANTYSYLLKTKHQWEIEIKNNTNKTIRSINLRLPNVKDLTSWGVSSSYLLEEEKNKLMASIDFQKSSGIIYLKDAVNLPPNADLKILLWGEFLDYSWDETLLVNYDGGTAKIEIPTTFTGLKSILAEYFFEIFLFILFTFILVYLLQMKKYADIKKAISKPN